MKFWKRRRKNRKKNRQRMSRKEDLLELLPAETIVLTEEVVNKILFLEKKMDELKELPFIQVDKKNNMRQRSTPAAKLYKELLQQYTNCVKILEAVIYRNRKLEGPEEEASPLEEWLMNHADIRKKDLDYG
mgnify:FL=1